MNTYRGWQLLEEVHPDSDGFTKCYREALHQATGRTEALPDSPYEPYSMDDFRRWVDNLIEKEENDLGIHDRPGDL